MVRFGVLAGVFLAFSAPFWGVLESASGAFFSAEAASLSPFPSAFLFLFFFFLADFVSSAPPSSFLASPFSVGL